MINPWLRALGPLFHFGVRNMFGHHLRAFFIGSTAFGVLCWNVVFAGDGSQTTGDGKASTAVVNVSNSQGTHPATDLINRELSKFWAANNMKPSARATDYEFVRRAFLDLVGRIPAVWEVENYVRDGDKNKRAKLIQRLLYDPYYREEFEDHWADLWATHLLTRSANRTYHEQMRDWFAEQLNKNRKWDEIVRDLLTATGSNEKNGAVNYILAHLGEPQRNAQEEGQFDMVPVTSRTTRLFLGIQIQCAQCHAHPFNPEWKQSHFWGVNAFFRQVERQGQPNMNNQRNQPAAVLTLVDNAAMNSTSVVYYEDRQAVVKAIGPRFLDGRTLPGTTSRRREALAEFIISHEMFPKAIVNRMWGHFFGRGLCQQAAVDDFGEHNPVVHPEILDGLAAQLKQYKYDLRELIMWICTSDAYALSCTANNTNAKPENEVAFSRMLLKAMSPEQLYDSLRTALDQPPDPKASSKKKSAGIRTVSEERKRQREDWLQKLTRNFGDDEGNEITFNGTVVQALLLMNGRELQQELARADNNTVQNAIAKGRGNVDATLHQLTLAALSRKANEREISLIRREYTKSGAGAPVQFWEDVFWALLNSREFILNH
jgi:hypothetical protein